MNVTSKLLNRYVIAAVLCAVLGAAAPAQAQRTRWEGRDAAGTTTVFQLGAFGNWTERVGGAAVPATYYFRQYSATADYIAIHDASRGISVALFNDRMDIYNAPSGSWGTMYRGGWASSPTTMTTGTSPNLLVRFTSMVIHDDKEGGNGDWRLRATFGGYNDLTIINKMEGGTGATLGIRSSGRLVAGRSFPVSARVFEHDGGIGAKWEFVGHQEVLVTGPGEYHLEFNNAEGHVTVYFEVTEP